HDRRRIIHRTAYRNTVKRSAKPPVASAPRSTKSPSRTTAAEGGDDLWGDAMTRIIPLDALVRRVSRLAEQMFDRQGDVDPFWLVENGSGEQRVIVSPIVAPSPLAAADYKDQLADQMRKLFAENDVVRYARAMECWALPGSGEMTCEQR